MTIGIILILIGLIKLRKADKSGEAQGTADQSLPYQEKFSHTSNKQVIDRIREDENFKKQIKAIIDKQKEDEG